MFANVIPTPRLIRFGTLPISTMLPFKAAGAIEFLGHKDDVHANERPVPDW